MDSGRWMNKFRVLTITLIFSAALNVGLIAVLILARYEQRLIPEFASNETGSEPIAGTNRQILSSMMSLSFAELATYLTNKDKVDEGYSKRDLALSALVAAHHFHLDKALAFSPIQRRLISLGPRQTVALYPGLSEEQYGAIIRFAYQEKWPLVPKGLFGLLKKTSVDGADPSLVQAFLATSEFHTLRTLFQKAGSPQEDSLLVNLVCEGPWEIIEAFSREQEAVLDFSPEKRRALLLGYLTYRSPSAARLLLQTDSLFVKNRFEDAAVETLLGVLPNDAAELPKFCLELLQTARSDAVLRVACEKLYCHLGEPIPEPFDLSKALARFALGKEVLVSKAPLPVVCEEPVRFREHIVKEGETLWKIARQYRVNLDALVGSNGIDKGVIFPGMTLRIPDQGTGSEPPR